MNKFSAILALSIFAACADLPEDQLTPDTEESATELGSIQQSLTTSPLLLLVNLNPPSPWSAYGLTEWKRSGTATGNPAIYSPAVGKTRGTT